ncbi:MULTISPECIES: tetratricopeptide repeat protein [Prochlorococcus]|uniref:Secreted TPR repeats protein n=1 Tax=Prochlorococcus marinus (strain SARG / CCMP1375 / SS120) TaxID=167539 RepID=Q7VEK6_PROMA|nr:MULTISPECIES: tetratricopeptide repeat protein [Prochlorococcus]AAP99052.1 Secreted TPR repeats protein [Prochlorococcus marinus subsp. marinus str. CCMP1375]KGG14414.1 hypothetical protein EV04_0055 [Prochlorococcus marinus str. LG]KGG23815.1 hypothetical protein EV09_0417 [Prochlorococcus marinus str. SS35]KGG33102.1 hypothetical protein EV10_0828 [Prochlorococcus marinus str. SS51]KGG37567.1 hypothetical protein EV11_0007 [Prochlorococcus sp. SS52]
MKNYKKIYWLICIILNTNLFVINKPSHAYIPNIYSPNPKVLIDTSIGIGLTASEYIKYGQTKEAIGLAKLAISLNPKEIELWIILARAQLSNNKLEEALISIERAKNINPNIPILWFTKASIEMQMGEIQLAINSINKCLKIEKKNSNAYFLLGNAKLIQKNHTEALDAFTKATKVKPNFWQAINNKGLIYFELGNKKQAIQIWRKVLKIKSDPEPKLALAIALYSIEPANKESIKLAKEALQENPNYFSQAHQKEQLWGEKLQEAGKTLFKNPKLKAVINKASANSRFTN